MAAEQLGSNPIYETLKEGLKETNIQILAPGLEGYDESIKRWSEAAEKRAVHDFSLTSQCLIVPL